MRMSYVEIYNEKINDLLDPSQRDLAIRDTDAGQTIDCEEVVVTSPAQVLETLARGEENRHFGSTMMNEHSSRSHTIFRLVCCIALHCVALRVNVHEWESPAVLLSIFTDDREQAHL